MIILASNERHESHPVETVYFHRWNSRILTNDDDEEEWMRELHAITAKSSRIDAWQFALLKLEAIPYRSVEKSYQSSCLMAAFMTC